MIFGPCFVQTGSSQCGRLPLLCSNSNRRAVTSANISLAALSSPCSNAESLLSEPFAVVNRCHLVEGVRETEGTQNCMSYYHRTWFYGNPNFVRIYHNGPNITTYLPPVLAASSVKREENTGSTLPNELVLTGTGLSFT